MRPGEDTATCVAKLNFLPSKVISARPCRGVPPQHRLSQRRPGDPSASPALSQRVPKPQISLVRPVRSGASLAYLIVAPDWRLESQRTLTGPRCAKIDLPNTDHKDTALKSRLLVIVVGLFLGLLIRLISSFIVTPTETSPPRPRGRTTQPLRPETDEETNALDTL